jgi:hypothetical protein
MVRLGRSYPSAIFPREIVTFSPDCSIVSLVVTLHPSMFNAPAPWAKAFAATVPTKGFRRTWTIT